MFILQPGDGHLGAAVSIVTGSSGCQGIVRMIQVSPDLCVIEGTIDHLTPGKHSVVVHELGDLSQGCLRWERERERESEQAH